MQDFHRTEEAIAGVFLPESSDPNRDMLKLFLQYDRGNDDHVRILLFADLYKAFENAKFRLND